MTKYINMHILHNEIILTKMHTFIYLCSRIRKYSLQQYKFNIYYKYNYENTMIQILVMIQ